MPQVQVQELLELPLDLIEPSRVQPRRCFDEAALDALAGSLSECGVLQPVLVRPLEERGYGLVVGERRWRAAKIAGLESIPALVSGYDDLAALEVGLIENMVREDLNPVEEARACTTLVEELGLTHEQIADRVGRSRVAVTNTLRLLDLSAEILEFLERGELSATHGLALLMVGDLQVRWRLACAAVEGEWSTTVLRDRARESDSAESAPDDGVPAQRQAPGQQEQDLEAVVMNVARVWGDALGVEVSVRSLPRRQVRVEVVFNSAAAALAVGGRLGERG